MRWIANGLALVCVLGGYSGAAAWEVNERLTLTGVLAGAVHRQTVSGASGEEIHGGALVFQPELRFRPSEVDELGVKLGFAADGSFAERTPFALVPWGADVQANVQNINGRGVNYLLNAWYKRHVSLKSRGALELTVGVIDATDYLDQNAYANDEYSQFMNPALVNAPNALFPSYDLGAAAVWNVDRFGLRAVGMSIGENGDGRSYTFLGVQGEYVARTALGSGTYRIVLGGTSRDFADPEGVGLERMTEALVSFDQALGKTFGVFVRAGGQSARAAVRLRALYTAGLVVRGFGWGRRSDLIGIAYGYLPGGNLDLERTQVLEAYYRLEAGTHFAVTADLQYMRDDAVGGGGPRGPTFSLRLVGQF